MTLRHGKDAEVEVGGIDLSQWARNVQLPREADTHDVTTYGNNNGGHRYRGGLTDGSSTIQGIYDDDAAGPQAVLEPLLGTTTTVVYRPEGSGAGLLEKTFSAVVSKYEETVPVADMITWQLELQVDGPVVSAAQV